MKRLTLTLIWLVMFVIARFCTGYAATLQASWNAQSVAGFKIAYQLSGASSWVISDVGLAVIWKTPGIPGSTYNVKVMAYDSKGNQSEWSPTVSATQPATPTGFKAWFSSLISWLRSHWG
jgi:hypothetical protein